MAIKHNKECKLCGRMLLVPTWTFCQNKACVKERGRLYREREKLRKIL